MMTMMMSWLTIYRQHLLRLFVRRRNATSRQIYDSYKRSRFS